MNRNLFKKLPGIVVLLFVIVFWIPTGAVWGGVEAQTVPTAGPTATETAKPTVANTQVPIVYPTYTNTPDDAPQTATAIVYEAQLTATAISEQAMLTVTALYQGAYQTATAGAQQTVLTSTALKQQLNATQTAQAALAKPVPSQTPTRITEDTGQPVSSSPLSASSLILIIVILALVLIGGFFAIRGLIHQKPDNK